MAQITLNSTGVASNGSLVLQSNGTTAAVTIDTSQRAAFVAGTAALPAITTTGDTNTGIFFPAADTIAFAEGGVESMRIDSAGNMGLGVTPSAWGGSTALQVGPSGSVAGNSALPLIISANAYGTTAGFAAKYITSNYATTYLQYQGEHRWNTAPSGTAGNTISFTQAMTLDSSGNLLVGTTVSPTSTGTAGVQIAQSSGIGLMYIGKTFSGSTDAMRFYYNGGGSAVQVGSINYTNTATAFNTSSDYRLKENIQPMTGALAKVQALNPVTYTWKADGSDGEGFIAHELQAVVPDAVTGEKDAVETYTDEDGVEQTRPVYQGIDTSFLVATLTAAIKEQQALITQLQADVAALKGASA